MRKQPFFGVRFGADILVLVFGCKKQNYLHISVGTCGRNLYLSNHHPLKLGIFVSGHGPVAGAGVNKA